MNRYINSYGGDDRVAIVYIVSDKVFIGHIILLECL